MANEATKEMKTDGATTEEKKEVVVPEKFKDIVEKIEKMSVLDLSELVSLLEDKFGVSAAAPMMAMGMIPGMVAPAEAVVEKSEFNVELTSAGSNKIAVIKIVKEITGLGLKDAKDMVDGAPTMIKESVKKEEAEEMKKKITEAGGQVTLK